MAKTVSVLDALYLAKEFWDAVSQETIVNCFRKAGFSEPSVEVCEEDNPSRRSYSSQYDCRGSNLQTLSPWTMTWKLQVNCLMLSYWNQQIRKGA